MAIGMIFSPPKDMYSKEVYDKIMEHLGDSFPPPSMSLHLKGTTEQGELRIVDVFESVEAFKEFAASHAPVYEALGINLDDLMKHISFFEIERTIK
jgi:hypothetical protein